MLKKYSILNSANIKALSLLLIIGAWQISYIFGISPAIILGCGVVLCLYIILFDRLIFECSEFVLIFLFALMTILGFMLLVFGVEGQLSPRPIYFYSTAQLVAIVLILLMTNKVNGYGKGVMVLSVILAIEMMVVLGQFTYITFGFGFSKIIENEYDVAFISGTLGNPNNSAALIGLLVCVLTFYYLNNNRKRSAVFVLMLSLFPIFLTLSRTMLLLWILNFLCIVFSGFSNNKFKTKRSGLILIISAIILIILIFNLIDAYHFYEYEVIERSISRALSLRNFSEDSSITFRLISHVRLIENFSNLGFGSFSDLNFFKYFQTSDDYLMKVNPHSYLVEYSLLFGYTGFVVVFAIFLYFTYLLLLKSKLPFHFRLLAVFALLFTQAVPSSLLTSPYFFVPFVFMWKLKK
jgi:hypothetical protein